MSIGSFINAGTGFLKTHTRVVAIWAAIYLVAVIAFMNLLRPLFGSIIAMQQQQMALRSAGAAVTPPVFPMGMFGTVFVVELVAGLLGLVAFAAVVRAAARGDGEERFAYLRFGMDELRLLGLVVLLLLIFLVVEIIAVVFIAIAAALGHTLSSGASGVVTGILAIVAFGATIYAEVRLSLAGVFTVIERRIVIRDAWRATKGQFWSLFLAYLILSLIYVVLTVIIIAITSPGAISAYASLNPAAIQAASQSRLSGYTNFSLMTIVQLGLGAVIVVPWFVILIAGMTRTAQDLTGLHLSIANQFD